MQAPPPNAADNAPLVQWPCAAPRYENWYALVNHPTRRWAFWWRYTLLTTSTGVREARVWAVPVDGDDPKGTHVLTQLLPLDAFKHTADPFRLTFGDAGVLEHGHMAGRVVQDGNTVEWDLSFPPSPVTIQTVGSPLWRAVVRPPNRSPNSAVRISGHVTINGTRVALSNAPGHQGHIGANKTAPGWVWGRAGGFEQDPDAYFEGLMGKKLGRDAISFHVGALGKDFHLNSITQLLGSNHTQFSLGQWQMDGQQDRRKLQVTVNAVGQEPVKVRYLATDGTHRFNCMFPLASCAVNITPALNGGNVATTLLAKNRANVEFVTSALQSGRDEDYLPRF
jgi:hypothetical protein